MSGGEQAMWTLIGCVALAAVVACVEEYLRDRHRKTRRIAQLADYDAGRARRRAEEDARLADAIATTAAMRPAVIVDHVTCAGPLCDTVLCYDVDPCPGLQPTRCAHHLPLCDDCATGECDECWFDSYDSSGADR